MFIVYQDRSGQYRWTLRDTNGKTVADSSESYVSRDGARRAATNVKALATVASTVDR